MLTNQGNACSRLLPRCWRLPLQFPDNPTRQQQRDAKQLVELLTRIYPCGDCARHFHEIVR